MMAQVREAAGRLLARLDPIARVVDSGEHSHDFYPQVAAAIEECLAQVAELRLWGPENRLPSSEAWNVAGHLLSRGWLQNQARTKPRGYAGDYEMLARIYENRLCDDPLGRLFDQYFQAQAAPQAVRNRMAMMADWIVEAAGAEHGMLRIAMVGSAFGLEIRDALQRIEPARRKAVRIALVDVDPAAIGFARAALGPVIDSTQLTAISTNLFRLPDRPVIAEPLGASNWIFCPGVFDYLDDATAQAMLRCLYGQLAPGGRLIVFQFAPHNPTRAYMEWFGNWYLTYRDEATLRQLVESADLSGARVEYGAEAVGVDLYAMISKQPVE
jgi:extracellular factor (EF) 3-hydroxypalmitic acid methyl ester biosynthesis protein